MSQQCPVCGASLSGSLAACPSCGFKLADRTQSFAPITMEPTPHMASQTLLEEACLKVVRGEQIGSTFRLVTNKEITIGRSPKCDIFLNDMTVSRDHATIEYRDGVFVLCDHGSYNGVWVNNVNVKSVALRDGDIIQIGSFCLLFNRTVS